MKLPEKLLEIQVSVDKFIKDGENTSDKYKFVSSDAVLETIRPKMNEMKLLLIPNIADHMLHEGTTKSGTTRFMTEISLIYTWLDVESGDKLEVPFYSQGVDLAGEKGVGKALTYAEKYFLLKFFHVPTAKDDPDGDLKTKKGEKAVAGTQAQKENSDYCRKSIKKMLDELYNGDSNKIEIALTAITKSDKRGYPGVSRVEDITIPQLGMIYDKVKRSYEERLCKKWEGPRDEG